jgi:RHS repeat-associated protein
VTVTHRYDYDDPMGRLSSRTTEIAVGTATSPAGFQSFTLGYDYDQWGNLAHLDYPHPVGGDCEMAESPSLAYTYGLTALQSVTDEDTLVQLLSGPNGNLPAFDANTGMMTEWWTRVGVNGADGWLRHEVQPDGTRSRPSSITATMNGVTPVFSSGAYAYDAVGNITGIGGDWTYVYDALSRLKTATLADQGSQSYDYDDVGNITNLNGQTIPVDSATNQLSAAGYDYDDRGNLKVEPMASGWIRHLKFDPANRLMAAWATGGSSPPADRYAFAYDTSGERVVRYRVQDDVVQDAFAYLRGEGGQVLTEFQWSQQDPVTHDGAWSRIKDYVYLGSQMMTRIERTLTNPETGEFESRYVGFAQDHLGSTRAEVGSAATSSPVTFWPFGDFVESPGLLESHMFTGHEREYMGSQPDVSPLEGLDYMHARYYSSGLGRFLSVDPVPGTVGSSQSWNRYAYSLNNPVLFTDPTGEKVNVADLDSDHREMLIEELEEKSGLDLDYEDGLLVSKGEVLDENGNPTGSKTAQEDLLKAIDSDTTHFVLDRSGLDSVDMGKAVGDTVFLDFDDISGIDAGDNDPSTMDASMVFLHELEHTFGLKDPSPGVLKTTPWKKGETVERVNTMREELNLPIRGQYQSKRDKKRGHYLPFSNGRLYAPVGVK